MSHVNDGALEDFLVLWHGTWIPYAQWLALQDIDKGST